MMKGGRNARGRTRVQENLFGPESQITVEKKKDRKKKLPRSEWHRKWKVPAGAAPRLFPLGAGPFFLVMISFAG
jgi:hypothetical protein